MEKFTTSTEIAAALGVNKRNVNKRANRERWAYMQEQARGGRGRRYIIQNLPREIRLAIAKHRAFITVQTNSAASKAGAKAGEDATRAMAARMERKRIDKEQQLAIFAQLTPERKAIAYARRDVLKARDAFVVAAKITSVKQGTADFCQLYNSGEIRMSDQVRAQVASVSVSTMLRWQRDFNHSGPAGLANGYKNPKKGTTSLPQEQQDFILAMLKHQPHSAIATIDLALAARFPQPPAISTTRRFINSWKEQNASLFLFVTNPDAWRNKHQFAIGDASEQVDRVNQVWEFDSTPADVMLVDGRHCVIGVIDVYPRRLKLLVSKSSRSTAVAALLRAAIIDWGVPEIAKTDNGADYVSKHIVQALEALGIEQRLCPPFTPENKPHIERAFKTFSHSFAELMPGYIGHSVADRKDIEARRSFAARLGNRDSAVEIKMTAEELQQYCDRWTDAVYHQTAHRGLDGKTPAEVARAWKGVERRIADNRALDILLAEAPQGDGSRIVTKNGLNVNRVNYISDGLAGLEGARVRIKLDPADLGTVYVYDQDGRFLTIAVDPMRKGIDRAEMAAKLRANQKAIIQAGTKQLRKVAREQAVEDMHEEILGFYEGRMAKVVELPRKSVDYSTVAIEEAGRTVTAIDRERREDRAADDILADFPTAEAADQGPEQEQPKKASKVVLMMTDCDRYNDIKNRDRSGGLSPVEAAFLDGFYKSRSGRMYLELEGDLRQKRGLSSGEVNRG